MRVGDHVTLDVPDEVRKLNAERGLVPLNAEYDGTVIGFDRVEGFTYPQVLLTCGVVVMGEILVEGHA